MDMHGNRFIFILMVLRDGPCQIYGKNGVYRTCHDMSITNNDLEMLGHAGWIRDSTTYDADLNPELGFEIWVLSDAGRAALARYEREEDHAEHSPTQGPLP